MSPVTRFRFAVDIGLPVGLYYGCTALGLTSHTGLIASACGAAALAIVGAVLERRLTTLPVVVAVGAVAGLLGGSDRLLLIRESYVGIPVALVLIGSAFTADPALNRVYRGILVGSQARESRWSSGSSWLAGQLRALTLLWGAVGLVASAAQIVTAYTLPIDSAVWVNGLIPPAAIVAACVLTGPGVGRIRSFLDSPVYN